MPQRSIPRRNHSGGIADDLVVVWNFIYVVDASDRTDRLIASEMAPSTDRVGHSSDDTNRQSHQNCSLSHHSLNSLKHRRRPSKSHFCAGHNANCRHHDTARNRTYSWIASGGQSHPHHSNSLGSSRNRPRRRRLRAHHRTLSHRRYRPHRRVTHLRKGRPRITPHNLLGAFSFPLRDGVSG